MTAGVQGEFLDYHHLKEQINADIMMYNNPPYIVAVDGQRVKKRPLRSEMLALSCRGDNQNDSKFGPSLKRKARDMLILQGYYYYYYYLLEQEESFSSYEQLAEALAVWILMFIP